MSKKEKDHGVKSLGSLSPTMEKALLAIKRCDFLVKETNLWRGKFGVTVIWPTVRALYARRLIKIVVESRHRKRHVATLSEIGDHVACNLERERGPLSEFHPSLTVASEESARFIAQAVM